ncbi:response regulator transcription factor [Marinobacterium weihaiense]|uniref:Response regulator transcription factor n=1 Tax=Marinobacterium weihaiense TaxID=2851016 RepID=A0ABS6MBS7_9GAMM|nr:response regulator transcription factor [Marinobacterium weihaiense]MBV0933296.1 response regulator transcription factor [Marinobacterium weihaiense]
MQATSPRIAVIEDNPDLQDELLFFLKAKGLDAWGANSAEAFWKQLHRTPADIVLIDVALPGEDGLSVLDYLSGLEKYGLIIMTAYDSMQLKQRGLSLGADLYLQKPVNFGRLYQYLVELWSRMCQQASAETDGMPAPLRWHLHAQHLVSPSGTTLPLTPQEHALLEILLRNQNEVCSKDQLHDLLFGYDPEPNTHRINVILSRLRSKARQHDLTLPIRAIFGKGIVFRDLSQ